MDKLNLQSKKLSFLIKLVNDLQSNFTQDIEEINLVKDDKMVIDN
jgi:hypothetical protein